MYLYATIVISLHRVSQESKEVEVSKKYVFNNLELVNLKTQQTKILNYDTIQAVLERKVKSFRNRVIFYLHLFSTIIGTSLLVAFIIWLCIVSRKSDTKFKIEKNLGTFNDLYENGSYGHLIMYILFVLIPCMVTFSLLLSSWFEMQFTTLRKREIALHIFDGLLHNDHRERDIIPEEFVGHVLSPNDPEGINKWYALRNGHISQTVS